MSIEDTLNEREKSYGSFADYCLYSDQLKSIMNLADNPKIQAVHSEGLHMIFSKIARILNGNPNHADSWHDIAGYATLVEKELLKDK